MKNGLRNFIGGTLIVSLLVPSFIFLLYPKQAEADSTSCLAGVVAGLGKTLGGAALSILAVPTADRANLLENAQTSAMTTGTFVKECVIMPLVKIIARSILTSFTNDMVRWINSGFKGAPLFVTNPEGFLADITDQTVGQIIEGLGPIGEIVCSPFDLQLRLSLGLLYSSTYQQEIHCRLSDIEKNVHRAFTGGVFGPNGWDNWLSLTAQPQNNIYGTYLKAVDTIDARIVGRHNIELKQLDWGKGFLGTKRCVAQKPLIDNEEELAVGSATTPIYATDADGNVITKCTKEVTETPGTVVENQLQTVLGEPIKEIGLAQDLDAILGALVGQMIQQVVGGVTGLFTSSDSSSQNSVASITADIQRQLNQNNATLPIGVLPEGQTPESFCADFSKNLYFQPKDANGFLLEKVVVQQGTVGADGKINYPTSVGADGKTYPTTSDTQKKTASGGVVAWTVNDYNDIKNFCSNLPYKAVIANATNQVGNSVLGGAGTNSETAGAQTQDHTGNIALNKSAEQISSYNGDYPASNGVDGGETDFSRSITGNETGSWWQVDLSADPNRYSHYTVKEITEVNIALDTGLTNDLYVFISPTPFDRKTSFDTLKNRPASGTFYNSGLQTVNVGNNTADRIIIKNIPKGVTGPYLRIQRAGGYVDLREVRVFGTETIGTAGASSPGPAAPTLSDIKVTVSPSEANARLSKLDARDLYDPNTFRDQPITARFTLSSQTEYLIPNMIAQVSLIKLSASGVQRVDINKVLAVSASSGVQLDLAIPTTDDKLDPFLNVTGSIFFQPSSDQSEPLKTGYFDDHIIEFSLKTSKILYLRQTLKVNMASADEGDYRLTVNLKDSNGLSVTSWATNFTIVPDKSK